MNANNNSTCLRNDFLRYLQTLTNYNENILDNYYLGFKLIHPRKVYEENIASNR